MEDPIENLVGSSEDEIPEDASIVLWEWRLCEALNDEGERVLIHKLSGDTTAWVLIGALRVMLNDFEDGMRAQNLE